MSVASTTELATTIGTALTDNIFGVLVVLVPILIGFALLGWAVRSLIGRAKRPIS